MTISIENLVKLISTSQAVYADFSVSSLRSGLESIAGGFTQKEADKFVDNYTIVGRQFSSSTGFQAVVFQDTSGKKVLAIRGSEQLGQDFIWADGQDIATSGFARNQAVDLYRYWKTLTTAKNSKVTYSIAEINTLYQMTHDSVIDAFTYSTSDYIALKANLANDVGLEVISPNDVVDVTGHSLGGNLAYVFASMFPNNVGQVVTINAPGIDRLVFNGQANLLNLGFAQVDASKITSIDAEGDLVHFVSGTQPGTIINISQEVGHGPFDGLANNHSVINGLDSLNLMNLFSKLDPSQANNPSGILADIMRKSSNQAINTFEDMLDGLRRILLGDSFTNKTTAGSKNDIDARNELYNNIDELNQRITNGNLKYLVGKVKFIKASGDTDLAKQSYSQFLSLYYLTPFVLNASDADLKFFDLDLYQMWYHDTSLSSEDRNNGKANFSDIWYQDRTAMLAAQISRNLDDETTDTKTNFTNQDIYYSDKIIPTSTITSEAQSSSGGRIQMIEFGNATQSTSLEGGYYDDRIYGGKGADTLSGKEGSDYLEGGAGDDLLYGGDGADQIYGGAGNDQLVGEGGNDILVGGDGTDTYTFTGQFGRDVIEDSDNSGSIVINGSTLSSLKQTAKDSIIYKGSGVEAIKIEEGNTTSLIITSTADHNNSVTIKNWTSGSLGIQLDSPDTVPETSLRAVSGDSDDNDLYPEYGQYRNSNGVLLYGNYVGSNIHGGDGDDYIAGSYGTDHLYGDNGDDWIVAEGGHFIIPEDPLPSIRGADTIEGGDGNDVISGRAKDSVWHGGKGRDMLLSNVQMNFGEGQRPYQSGSSASEQRDSVWRDLLNYTKADYKVYSENKGDGIHYSYSAWAGVEPGSYSGNSILNGWTYTINLNSNTPLHDSSQTSGEGVAVYDYFSSRIFTNYNADFYYTDPLDEDKKAVNYPASLQMFSIPLPENVTAQSLVDVTYGALFGDEGDDLLVGWYGRDELYGGADNDVLWGEAGNDILDGGEGNDTLAGGVGSDTLIGGAGNDLMMASVFDSNTSADKDVLYGGAGNDSLSGGDGDDYLDGGIGVDELVGGGGNDYLYGGDDDVKDILDGGAGNDTFIAGQGLDYMSGGGGDDVFILDTHEVYRFTTTAPLVSSLNNNKNADYGFPENAQSNAAFNANSVTISDVEGNNTIAILGQKNPDDILHAPAPSSDNAAAQFPLVGLSDSANLVGIYEKDKWQARIAYNWRDKFLDNANIGNFEPEFTKALGQVDFNVGYKITEDLTVALEGTNVLGADKKTYGRTETQVKYVDVLEPRYALSARYNF